MPADPAAGLLSGLTEAQRLAVTAPDAPLCVLAAAGSGKTRVLTRRVAYRALTGSAEADHTLVVTFTRRAAGELRSRLARTGVDGVWAGTFHAAAFELLRRHWADHDRRPPVVVDGPRRLVRAVLGAASDPDEVARLATEIDWAGARTVGPDGYEQAAAAAGRRPEPGTARVAECYAAYVARKQARGVVDLADLLAEAARVLESDPVARDGWRWRWRHLFVDEFQDVNPAQWRLLRAWLGDDRDLFVVGDPDQAIYGWNGAEPGLLRRLPELLAGTTVLRLDEHHRCTPQVVAAARAVLPGEPARCTRPDGPSPVLSGFDDQGAEALAVARFLRRAHRPDRPWSHLAVLARSHARLAAVAEALERAGIPTRHRTAGVAARWRTIRRQLATGPTDRLLRGALSALRDAGTLGPLEGDDLAAELERLADELVREVPDPTVGAFLAWSAASGWSPDHLGGPADAVELASFHQAKGLEWPVVALVGLEDGLVPVAHAVGTDAVEEERRLLYVAVTRAEEELWLSWAAARPDGRPTRGPSPFLAGVAAAAGPPPVLDGPSALSRIGVLRSRLLAG